MPLAERDGLEELGRFAVEMAEGLHAHARSIAVRFRKNT